MGFTEQGLATVEKVGARGSRGFPWGHRRNKSTGVIPEARKYMVVHGENIAFGEVYIVGYFSVGRGHRYTHWVRS